MKKKKGNSLLLLLVIAMVIVVLGGTLTTSMAYSTKGNFNAKINEDLLLAAESGLEVVLSKIKTGNIAMPESGTYTYRLEDDIFKTYNNIEVDVEIKKENTYYKAKSIAKKNEKSRSVVAKIESDSIFIPGDKNAYRYTLCGKKIDVNASGSLNTYVTRWNAEDKVNSSVIGANEQVNMNMESNSIIEPKFADGFEKSDTIVTINSMQDMKDLGNRKGVRYIPSTVVSGVPINVYLINAEEVYIGNIGAINATIIITNGRITMNSGAGGNVGLSLNESLLFAEEFKMTLPSFHATYTLQDNAEPVRDIINNEDERRRLDDEIRKHCVNWNSSVGGIVTGVSYEITEIEYID